MNRHSSSLCAIVFFAVATLASQSRPDPATVVGFNVQVSTVRSTVAHFEILAAANPTNPKRQLLAAGGTAAQTTNLPPVSIEDTLAFRQIQQVQIRPDGAQVAFVTRKAIPGTRRNEDTLMTVPADGGASRVLLTGNEIQLTNWDNSGRLLCVLRKLDSSTQVVQVNVESERAEVLWQTDLTVENAAIAANRRFCLVAVRVPRERMSAQQAKDDGVVFEYGRDTFQSLVQHYDVAWLDVFAVDAAKTARKVARLPYHGIQQSASDYLADLSIAADDRKAALTLIREGKPTQGGPSFKPNIAVLDLQSGVLEPVQPGSPHVEVAATWLGGSDRLFFFSNGEGKIYDTTSKSIDSLTWAKLKSPFSAGWGNSRYENATNSVTYRQTAGGLGHVFFRDRTVQLDDNALLDGASYTPDGTRHAFVSESSQQRPEVAVRETKSGDGRRLTDLNAYLDQRALGKVEKWTFTNRYGAEATGYLMYPAAYEQGKRYPLLLASYGFRGKFPLIAEWHTSFPAQTLAGEGYAVLMLNLPSGVLSGQAVKGNPRQARENEGWQVLSTFEMAIEDLVKRGIADPDRLGLYGWSHGGFVVEFLLAHSKMHFKAASLGEGGDYNPGEYWIWGNKTWPAILTNLYGGPLTSKTVAGYLEFAPSLNVDKVNTPLLMEFATIGNYGAEFYIPMREMGVPAELVFYEGEKHNFERPTVRFVSMNRKVDWFNFWILGAEDPAPAKAEQYARWKKMRIDWKSGSGVAKNVADPL